MDDGAAIGETGNSAEEVLGRRAGAIESRVGYDVSSAVVVCAREGETMDLSGQRWEQKSLVLGLTRRFLSKDRGVVIVVQSSYGNAPSDGTIPPAP